MRSTSRRRIALQAAQPLAEVRAATRSLSVLARLLPEQVEELTVRAFAAHGEFKVLSVKGEGKGKTQVKIQCQNCVGHGTAVIVV